MGTHQFFAKLRSIKYLLFSNHVLLFTVHKGKPHAEGYGGGELEDVMIMAVQMKKSYNSMIDMLETASIEEGSLHTFTAMRKAIEALDARQ